MRVRNEALSIDRNKKEVAIKDHTKGKEYRESYDYLVLSPGAEPIRPPLNGINNEGIFSLRTVNDTETGANERVLNDAGIKYHNVIIHPNNHAGYYPGASPLSLKLLFSPEGKILGAQAIGYNSVEKRIDILATALRSNSNVYDLQELELAYAPPYSSAKDPVNMAGFVATNLLQGDYRTIEAAELNQINREKVQILDVRESEENELG